MSETIKDLVLLSRHYENWATLALNYVRKRPSRVVILKDGTRINSSSGIRSLSALANLLQNGWKINHFDDRYLLLENLDGIRIKCRMNIGNDIGHLVEIFVTAEYSSQFANKTVLDIGMSNGDSSIYFAKSGGRIVIGVEPYPESFELANENVILNHLEGKVIVLNCGLSSSLRQEDLKVSSESPNANSLKANPSTKASNLFDIQLKIRTITIDEIISRYDLKTIDLLKMDCEGCEYDVIRSLSPKTLDLIEEIILEFHEGPQDLVEILSRNQFRIEVKNTTKKNAITSMGYIRARRIRAPVKIA